MITVLNSGAKSNFPIYFWPKICLIVAVTGFLKKLKILSAFADISRLRPLNQSKNFNKYKNLWRVDIKDSKKWMGEIFNNNKSLFDRGYKFALVNTWTYPAHELHGSIKRYRTTFFCQSNVDGRVL